MLEPQKNTAASPSQRRRQRVLDAAARCFAQHGFAKTTVEEIAQAAGVSKGLVYVHFSSKEDLLEVVLDQTLRLWADTTWEQVGAERSVVEAIATMHRASISYALRHPLLRRILERDARLLLSHVDEPARRATEEWGEKLASLIERGIEHGELRRGLDVGRTTDVVRLLHLSFLERLFEDDFLDVSDPDLIDHAIDALLFGIARPTGRTAHA